MASPSGGMDSSACTIGGTSWQECVKSHPLNWMSIGYYVPAVEKVTNTEN